MTDTIYLYVPRNLDAASLLPQDLKPHTDCMNYLVHCVVCGQVFWHADSDGFVPLKVAYLRKVIPDRIEKTLRNWCIANGILECDGQYIEGKKSLGYRLAPSYRVQSRRIECKDPKVACRISELREIEFSTEITLDVHRHLQEWYLRLDIDVEQATDIALNLEHSDIHLTASEMIAHHHNEFSFCNKGRVHTVVTRLARELRTALRMNGEALYNLDVSNSQPLILAMLVMQYRAAGNQFSNIHSFDEERPINPYIDLAGFSDSHSIPLNSRSYPNPTNPPPSPIGDPFTSITMSNSQGEENRELENTTWREGRATLKEDEKRYVDLCENGQFYEYLQVEGNLQDIPRDEIKVKFYRDVFFGRNQVSTDLTKKFESLFPNVMAVIRAAKRKNYRQLACMMQNFESSLIINRVCRRLMEERPDAPIITIHDSIMTTKEHVELVRSAMTEEFSRVGLRPSLKIEFLGTQPLRSAA